MTAVEPLKPLDEDFDRVLAIVAHPDDLEYGAAAAIARWTAAGKAVGYVIVTDGEAGIDALEPERATRVRRCEQLTAARAVGVDHVRFLDRPDGVVEYSLELRRALAAEIRRFTPDALLIATHRLTFGDHALNQADHRNVSLAALDAAKDAGNPWIHRSLLDAGLEPHTGTHTVLVFGSTAPTHAVEVTGYLDAAVASLRAHATYLNGLDREVDPAGFVHAMTTAAGERLGVPHAVAIERISNAGA